MLGFVISDIITLDLIFAQILKLYIYILEKN